MLGKRVIDPKQILADPDKVSAVAKTTGATSIITGTGAAAGTWFGWIEANAATIGIGIAALTMIANIAFQWLERKDRLKRYEQSRQDKLNKQSNTPD